MAIPSAPSLLWNVITQNAADGLARKLTWELQTVKLFTMLAVFFGRIPETVTCNQIWQQEAGSSPAGQLTFGCISHKGSLAGLM